MPGRLAVRLDNRSTRRRRMRAGDMAV